MYGSTFLLGMLATVMNGTLTGAPVGAGVEPTTGSTASTQELLRGTSDAFQGTLDLQVIVDDSDSAVGLRAMNGTTSQDFPLTTLSDGLVLFAYEGHDVVILKSGDFNATQGGTFDVSYLKNALTGDYGDVTVDVNLTGTTWQMSTDDQSGREVVTNGYFKANKVFGQTVGIDSITLTP